MREKVKKSTPLLIILCLVLSVFGGSAYAAHRYFEDAKGHWAEDAMELLADQINDYADLFMEQSMELQESPAMTMSM